MPYKLYSSGLYESVELYQVLKISESLLRQLDIKMFNIIIKVETKPFFGNF